MKLISIGILLFVISCAPRENKTESSTDSVSTLADASVTDANQVNAGETAVPDEPEHEPTWGDSYFEPDLFITLRFDSMVMLLKSRSIDIEAIDSYKDDYDSLKIIKLAFGSEIEFYQSDDKYYLHTAVVKTPEFPFKNGLIVGMPRREAIGILGIDSTKFDTYGDVDTYAHDFILGSGDHMLYVFSFSNTAFVGFKQEYQDMD